MKILALDYETSGLDPQTHAPVTLGVAVMEGDEILAQAEWLFAPPTDKNGKINRAYDVTALEINGVSWTRIKRDGLPISAVMAALGKFAIEHKATSLPVVAFNAPFDFAWYSTCLFLGGSWNQHRRCFETFKPPLIGPWQCARLMACDSLRLDGYSLDAVCAHFELARTGETHGALEDAVLAGRVFHRLSEANAARASA